MADAMERLKSSLAGGKLDPALLAELEMEYNELKNRANKLEEHLIMIVRTGWPWDEEGEPNAIYRAVKDGFATAMAEAREMLGLGHLSRLTRTEPKT